MAVKVGLQERFKTTDFLNADRSHLERIAALYYRARRADQLAVRAQLRQALQTLNNADAQEILLRLHLAITLAQHGEYDGVVHILDMLHNSMDSRSGELAEIALRNCNQFPLAVLLGQALNLQFQDKQQPNVNALLHLSDDDLFSKTEKGVDQQATFEQLSAQISALNVIPRRMGRELAIGTILCRPVRQDRNYRYSGFVVIDQGLAKKPLVIPYDLGDVLNRDDSQARQDVWQLTRRPGRRAIVVYNTASPYETQQLYILPFAVLRTDELVQLVFRLAMGADGLQVGVTADLVTDRNGYRVITADGQCLWETFQPERKKIGSCVLIHELNSASLSTELFVSPGDVSQVLKSFQTHSTLPKAVLVRSYQDGHTLIGPTGKIYTKHGSFSDQIVYYLDTVITREGRQIYIPFTLPGLTCLPADRAQIVSGFFQNFPDVYGVVLDTYTDNKRLWARVVLSNSEDMLITQAREDMSPGTLALCEMSSKDGRMYADFLMGYSIRGGCPDCFGTSRRSCIPCEGTGYVLCPNCNGTQQLHCPEPTCAGGVIPCAVCSGTGSCKHCTNGYWRNGQTCPICQGSGKCQKCKPPGSGKWGCGKCHGRGTIRCNHCKYGEVECPDCKGEGVTTCACNGENQGYIVAV